jgi:lysophospholipid acyltransferase (LPLAT)-like uncharacterized protein
MRALWRVVRQSLRRRPWLAGGIASGLAAYLRFIDRTNRQLPQTEALKELLRAEQPVIIALWHGQHLMASFVAPRGMRFAALFSRSADAELNALVAEKLGVTVIRGSGGREGGQVVGKGGARALIQLKRALEQGISVVMIADISKSAAREAGVGIVTLAKLSGRPIVPAAYASSRGLTINSSWDRMRFNLPFGRAAAIAAEPVRVARDASPADLEEARRDLTKKLNDATQRAQAMVVGKA